MRTSPYSNALGAQPGVQVKTDQADAFELSAVADQIVAMGSRASRGPIDRAFLVTRADADSRLGPVRSNLVRPEHEARMQVSEALDAGAAGVVVSRIVPASSSKRYAAIKLRDNATVVGVQALLVDAGAISESDVAVFFVWMSSSSGASGLPFVISGVSPGDYSTVQFTGGVTQSQGLLTVPAGVSDFIVTIQLVEDQLLEGVEVMTISVGGVDSFGSIGIYDTSIPPPPLPIQYGAQLWLDASDHSTIDYNQSTGVLQSWQDKSGSGRHATKNAKWVAGNATFTTANVPLGGVWVGRGALDLASPVSGDSAFTFIAAVYLDGGASNDAIYLLRDGVFNSITISGSGSLRTARAELLATNNSLQSFGTNQSIEPDKLKANGITIVSMVINGSFQTGRVLLSNTVVPLAIASTLSPKASNAFDRIGWNSASINRNYQIAEMMFFGGALSDAAISELTSSLMQKYGVT